MRQDNGHPDDVLGRELGHALNSLRALSAPILRTQLAGAMVAAVCFSAPFWGAEEVLSRSRPAAFLLAAAGGVLGYVVLSLTGCLIAHRVLRQSEPVHPGAAGYFLVDHWRTAVLPPLICSGIFALICGIFASVAALWFSAAWQAILVIPSAGAFAVVVAGIVLLFALLFLIPPAVVMTEGATFRDVLDRLAELMWTHRVRLARKLAVGLIGAFLIALPGALVIYAGFAVFHWIYLVGSGNPIEPFSSLILAVFKAVLVGTPVLTCSLAFLCVFWSREYASLLRDDGEPGPEAMNDARQTEDESYPDD